MVCNPSVDVTHWITYIVQYYFYTFSQPAHITIKSEIIKELKKLNIDKLTYSGNSDNLSLIKSNHTFLKADIINKEIINVSKNQPANLSNRKDPLFIKKRPQNDQK